MTGGQWTRLLNRYSHLILPVSLIVAGLVLFYYSTRLWWLVLRHYWGKIWNHSGGSVVDRIVEIASVTPRNVSSIFEIFVTETPVNAALSTMLITVGAAILVHRKADATEADQ